MNKHEHAMTATQDVIEDALEAARAEERQRVEDLLADLTGDVYRLLQSAKSQSLLGEAFALYMANRRDSCR
jgi:hypothetical protein